MTWNKFLYALNKISNIILIFRDPILGFSGH